MTTRSESGSEGAKLRRARRTLSRNAGRVKEEVRQAAEGPREGLIRRMMRKATGSGQGRRATRWS